MRIDHSNPYVHSTTVLCDFESTCDDFVSCSISPNQLLKKQLLLFATLYESYRCGLSGLHSSQ